MKFRVMRGSDRRRSMVPWITACAAALIVLGPVLRPGVLFNLDLIVPSRLETPIGFWGLGPELPRRLPMWALIAWISAVVPATVVAKSLMFAVIVAAWLGMTRLVERIDATVGLLATQSAAAIYALSPFVLTRAVVGHFMVTVPHAMLPWLLPVLLRRRQRDRTVFLAAAALGFTGHFGGSLAICIVGIAALCGVLERPVRAMLLTVAAQSAWLIPGVVVALTNTGANMSGTDSFPTHARGFDGLSRLSAGGGFWNQYYQVGSAGWMVAVLGAALLGLAFVGTRDLAAPMRRVLVTLGAVGWLVAAASALGGLSFILSTLNDRVLFGIWRDGQRLLSLHLLWLAPCAVLGARRLTLHPKVTGRARPVAALRALPMGVAAALAIPGVWGFGGQLAAQPLPQSWGEARELIRADPGTVLVLPWQQYFNLRIGEGPVRRVLDPVPLYIGGDVLASSDNGLSSGNKETADPREPHAAALVERLARGESAAAELGALGVKWVVALDRARLEPAAGLVDDPLVRRVVDDDRGAISLYRLADDEADGSSRISWHLPILASVPATDVPVALDRPGSAGWFRGWSAASTGPDGRPVLPAGSGLVWNAPGFAAVAAQFVWAAAVAAAFAAVIHRRRRGKFSAFTNPSTS